nr:MAG TPA: hypothetical protein [Caudoviricetes sp.]
MNGLSLHQTYNKEPAFRGFNFKAFLMVFLAPALTKKLSQ